jgi:hypothetical protein
LKLPVDEVQNYKSRDGRTVFIDVRKREKERCDCTQQKKKGGERNPI